MNEQQHPIAPPPELVERLRNDAPREIRDAGVTRERHLIIAAYCAGADRELDACCEWVRSSVFIDLDGHDALRAARRPKPPSLAEQALDSLDRLRSETWCEGINFDLDPIRRALERLQELESNG